jgi:hypothetical protein
MSRIFKEGGEVELTKSFLDRKEQLPEEFNILLKLTENELTLLYAVLRDRDPNSKLPLTVKIKDSMYVFERKN